MNKLNLKYADLVRVHHTGSDLDGVIARVAGLSTRGLIDIYILEFLEDEVRTMPDGSMDYSSFTMPEVCLERVK